MEWVADVVDRANGLLSEESDAAIGHSYFISQDRLGESDVRTIWMHGVLPYVQEHLFGAEEDRIRRFDLDRLLQATDGGGG